MNEFIDDLSVMDDLKFPKSWLNNVNENTFVSTLFTTSHTKLTYAFFYNYLKDLKENSKYVKEFEEYFRAYRQFNQFREEQINLKNPDEESKLKLAQLAIKAMEKESEIRKLNVDMGQFVFPELKIEDYKALLNDDEAILVILKSREQGPSMQLYIESNLARIMPSGWDFERYKKHIDEVLLDIEQRNIAGLNLLSILKLKEMYTHFLGPINDTKKFM